MTTVNSSATEQPLRAAEQALAGLIAEAEPVFRPIGDLLADSATLLAGMADRLYELGGRLQSDEARRAAEALAVAVAGTRSLAEGSQKSGHGILSQLQQDGAGIGKHLESLRRIVGEVTALAINGKIQSVLVSTAGVDFTVFTSEIGRLGKLATDQIEQSVQRLAAVVQSIGVAIDAESSFARNEATELTGLRTRLEANLSLLADRSGRAAQAVVAVEAASRDISARVAAAVGQLQINDITCQRIDHARLVLHGILAGQWRQSLPAEAAARIEQAGCSLQQRQLEGAAADYRHEIDEVISNLRGLSEDSAALLREAEQAFGDSQGGLFLHDIEHDVARAVMLVDAYSAARRRTAAMVAAVSAGFLEMAKDLEAIRSIDADMRIMGLNATLKCGRLGNSGRALGVVAQELRSCSLRTEDTARTIGQLLEAALANSRQLSDLGDIQEGTPETAPQRVMERSIADLSAVSAAMSDSLDALRREAPSLSASLADCAGSISFHHRLCGEIDRSIALIDEAAGGGAPNSLDESDYRELRHLVEPLYTMDSERAVHAGFDGLQASVSASAPPTESVDDLFF